MKGIGGLSTLERESSKDLGTEAVAHGEDPGIIPRAIFDIFACIREKQEREFLLRVSYIEIYNEDIIDLLDTPSTEASGHPNHREP